jgi:undecaprenyl diphosphate synthase
MDGNRRYARQHNKPVLQGHAHGAATGSNILEWWLKYLPNTINTLSPNRPKYLTCWAFSAENFARPQEEKEGLFRIMEAEFKSLAFTSLVHLFRIRVCVIGGEKEMKQLPIELRDLSRCSSSRHGSMITWFFYLLLDMAGVGKSSRVSRGH